MKGTMETQFSRSERIYGQVGIQKLQQTHIAVFGLGGVGGYVAESLVRTGLGYIDLIDHDTIDITNLNRQIIATHETLGMKKVDAARERLASINPTCDINTHDCFYSTDTADRFDLSHYDYVVDAIDTVSAKLELITRAKALHVPIISAMGAGNKTDPTALRIADIYQTSVCPLARIMRKELRKRGIDHLTVCYSTEPVVEQAVMQPEPQNSADNANATAPDITSHPVSTIADNANPVPRRSTPGSNAFVPSAMGLAMAAYVVQDVLSCA